MKEFAGTNTNEPIVPIPPVIKPVEVELAVRIIAIRNEHLRVAIRVQPQCTERHLYRRPFIPERAGVKFFGIVMP